MGKIIPQETTRHKILNNMSSTYIFLHLNEFAELLLIEEFDGEVVNSMIMRQSVVSARRKRRDFLYLIN